VLSAGMALASWSSCVTPAEPAPVPSEVVTVTEAELSPTLEAEAEVEVEEKQAPPAIPMPRPEDAEGDRAQELRHDRDARRSELSAAIALQPGWNLYECEHYFLATPIDDPRLIDGLKRRCDALSRALLETYPPARTAARKLPTDRSVIRVLPSREAFQRAGASPGTTCYWNEERKEIVMFDDTSAGGRGTETWPALQHIVVHEYLSRTLQADDTAAWIKFGIAAHYEGLELGPAGWEAPQEDPRWRELDAQLTAAECVPLERLLRYTTEEFYGANAEDSGGRRNLILAWSLYEYLRTDELRYTPAARIPSLYLRARSAGSDHARALEAALAEVNLPALEKDWRDWLMQRTDSL